MPQFDHAPAPARAPAVEPTPAPARHPRRPAPESGRPAPRTAGPRRGAPARPPGNPVERSHEIPAAARLAAAPPGHDHAPARRLGSAPESILAIVGLLACAYGIQRRRRKPPSSSTLGIPPTPADVGVDSADAEANAIKEMM
ncbi:hypothetical protein [Embleya sp. AB8]|uniref:hypothetical protein n=1 Tax=Embleya sp. AB8 TaxID=3156304 RepID=UPI003C795301